MQGAQEVIVRRVGLVGFGGYVCDGEVEGALVFFFGLPLRDPEVEVLELAA